ncbi:CheY-like chemotaxis protein [Paraburkholderia atlantica]
MDRFGQGQRNRYRLAVLRTHFHDFPALALACRIPWHANRPRAMQAYRRTAWRPHLGGIRARWRIDLLFHAECEVGWQRSPMLSQGTSNPVHILLIEDSPTDVLMPREALGDQEVLNPLHVVQDGAEAMDFLHRTGRHHDAPRPGLIILDLNLPKKSCREVLDELKADPDLMVFPSSCSPRRDRRKTLQKRTDYTPIATSPGQSTLRCSSMSCAESTTSGSAS